MNLADSNIRRALLWVTSLIVVVAMMSWYQAKVSQEARAAPAPPGTEPGDADDPLAQQRAKLEEVERQRGAEIAAGQQQAQAEKNRQKAAENGEGQTQAKAEDIPILDLLYRGGPLMIPILAMSVLVVMFGVERALGLRRGKVMPAALIGQLGHLASQPGGLDPRKAYRLCQQYPSAAATVIRTVLLKVGRPHSELEHAVAEASEREADRLYSNVRWISLAAAISPLMGLLGTVWGMIQAFMRTADPNITIAARGPELAKGIYVALVTTFSGLAVAIPAAILAHWFEGRIQKLFRELDETLLGVMPQLERFEGKLRISPKQLDQPQPPPPPQTAPAVGTASTPPQPPDVSPRSQPTH